MKLPAELNSVAGSMLASAALLLSASCAIAPPPVDGPSMASLRTIDVVMDVAEHPELQSEFVGQTVAATGGAGVSPGAAAAITIIANALIGISESGSRSRHSTRIASINHAAQGVDFKELVKARLKSEVAPGLPVVLSFPEIVHPVQNLDPMEVTLAQTASRSSADATLFLSIKTGVTPGAGSPTLKATSYLFARGGQMLLQSTTLFIGPTGLIANAGWWDGDRYRQYVDIALRAVLRPLAHSMRGDPEFTQRMHRAQPKLMFVASFMTTPVQQFMVSQPCPFEEPATPSLLRYEQQRQVTMAAVFCSRDLEKPWPVALDPDLVWTETNGV